MKRLFVSILLCTTTICVIIAQESQLNLGVTQGHPYGGDIEQVSPDKKYLLTTSWEDGSAKLWELKSGKLVYTIDGLFYKRTGVGNKSCVFSKNGKLISCSSCTNATSLTTIWKTETGSILKTYDGCDAAFVNDETLLVGNSLWNIENQALVRSFKGTFVGLSSDGKHMAINSFDESVMYDVANGDKVFSFKNEFMEPPFSALGNYVSTKESSYNGTEYTIVHKIYDRRTGKPINQFQNKSSSSNQTFILPNEKYYCSVDFDSIFIWEITTGKLLPIIRDHKSTNIKYSPCGKYLLIDNKLIEIQTGARTEMFPQSDYLFSANYKYLYQIGDSLKIYDLVSKRQLPPMVLSPERGGQSVEFVDSGGEKLIIGFKVYDLKTRTEISSIKSSSHYIEDAFFGEADKELFLITNGVDSDWDGVKVRATKLESSTGNIIDTSNPRHFEAYGLSPDGKSFVWGYRREVISDTILNGKNYMPGEAYAEYYVSATKDSTNQLLKQFGSLRRWSIGGDWKSFSKNPKFFSPNGKYIRLDESIYNTLSNRLIREYNSKIYLSDSWEYHAINNDGKSLTIAKTEDGSILHTIYEENSGCVFSPNHEQLILKPNGYGKFRAFDLKAKSFSFEFDTQDYYDYREILFSHDSKNIAVQSSEHTVELFSNQGKIVSQMFHKTSQILLTVFAPKSDQLVTISDDKKINIWSAATGQLIKSIIGSDGTFLNFSRDKKFALTSNGPVLNIIDTESWEIKLTKTMLKSGEWVVTHPSGLFDASPAAMSSLYFVQGIDIIEFGQLKERYYEPGLWKKVMSGEKLRNVVGMKSIELPPDIRVGQVDDKGYLPIELVNKGGGIGEVTVFINGKEAIADARPKGSNSKTNKLSLNVYIGNHKALIKGSDNFIAVKAWNEGHWVVSRAAGMTYAIEGNEKAYKPAIHIITSGVSDYTGTELDLKYAAKDAEDVSKALQLGAKKLFGTERSYIYNLTTSQSNNQYPTKANILKTFEKVSSVAHPLDVVVVYLSGHGINHGGQDGDWYYLTYDAYTSSSSAYNDPEIRRISTVSSNELVELFKKVPALKQVLMIDACASGKVVENLMAKKDIESTTLRALDRMRDRTGLHIITGCTADAVSYEASKYGQGVLTYSLLEGIRGAALREDQFVDINKLFQYAHDRVPTLAEGIGGIQTPQVFSPQGGQSFDIGVMGDIEKKEIPIAKIRPVYIRSAFIDDDQLEDALQLGKKVDDGLNEAASKGTGSSIIFVDVRDYPEGCKLSGKYKLEGGIIKLKLRKKCEGKDETIEIQGKTVEEVRGKILSSL